jgi:hypothetical protein
MKNQIKLKVKNPLKKNFKKVLNSPPKNFKKANNKGNPNISLWLYIMYCRQKYFLTILIKRKVFMIFHIMKLTFF